MNQEKDLFGSSYQKVKAKTRATKVKWNDIIRPRPTSKHLRLHEIPSNVRYHGPI